MKMFKIKTALLLCAGYGKRLNPLTLKNPKPLLKLNDLTLLENTINLIKKLGISDIKLNTFYLKDQIKIFIEQKNFDVKIEIIEDGNQILDTGGGILNMTNSINEEDFLVFNPDTVWSIDYLNCIKEMENFYFSKKIKNILMVVNKNLSFDKNLNGDFSLLEKSVKVVSLNELLKTCDAISIATPASHHYKVAEKALKYNCHLFIEKPITNNIIEAQSSLKPLHEHITHQMDL